MAGEKSRWECNGKRIKKKRDKKPLDWQVGRKPEPYDPKMEPKPRERGKERVGKMGFGDSVAGKRLSS